MRSLRLIVIGSLLFCGVAWGMPPADESPVRKIGENQYAIDGSVTVGTPVSVISTEYPVWQQKDSNGDVVAEMVVTCTDITDGQQDCSVLIKVMHDTPGTLTTALTVN